MNAQRRRVGVIEVAQKFHCHPNSIPRLIKERRLPPPDKLLNKNVWWEDLIDDLVEQGLPPKKEVAA
jgi:predicted DNA-binding transcriptional regulator AlpA